MSTAKNGLSSTWTEEKMGTVMREADEEIHIVEVESFGQSCKFGISEESGFDVVLNW